MKKENKKYFISVIVIGYNTKDSLLSLMSSLNNQSFVDFNLIEIIYIDDGSQDGSVKAFQKLKLNFEKKTVCLKKNMGRVFATQTGINMACGEWFFFVRSNVVLEKNALSEFSKSINRHRGAVAFMGSITYSSADLAFQNYLNSFKRGINQYKHHQKIHYKYLLFGNSMIRSEVFKKLQLNPKMRCYGGEELDLAEKIYLYYQKPIRACKKARAARIDHPGFEEHCNRMESFGQYNFEYMSLKNQKLVLGLGFYLKTLNFLSFVWVGLSWFSKKLYKFSAFQYWTIRLGLFCFIMLGVLKSKRARNFQTPHLPVWLLPTLLVPLQYL